MSELGFLCWGSCPDARQGILKSEEASRWSGTQKDGQHRDSRVNILQIRLLESRVSRAAEDKIEGPVYPEIKSAKPVDS